VGQRADNADASLRSHSQIERVAPQVLGAAAPSHLYSAWRITGSVAARPACRALIRVMPRMTALVAGAVLDKELRRCRITYP
jgi:hypothetical protein